MELNRHIWKDFPMGPRLKAYLAVDEMTLHPQETAPSDNELDFTSFLKSYHPTKPIAITEAVGVMDELVTMALPQAALDMLQFYPEIANLPEFAPQLTIGVAAMMQKSWDLAESALRKAQEILPEEPAPYVNLAQIYQHLEQLQDAEIWIHAGLEADLNNHRLWELLAQITYKNQGEFAPETLMKFAQTKSSWAGISMASEMITTGDRHLKATLLEKIYDRGERDPLFLIELTGAFGIAGEFEKIPQIVWQAERMNTKGLPWQLHAHGAQAEIALGSPEKARVQIAKARKDPFVTEEALESLKFLEDEMNHHH